MTTKSIRSAPSGPRVDVLVPPDIENPDPTKYLNEDGTYTTPAGSGNVDSVQGSNGITPDTPQTGAVTLDGGDLLPRDGSRPMTSPGLLLGTVNGVTLDETGSGNTLYLDDAGQYTAPPGGGSGAVDSVQGSGGITPTTAQTGAVTLDGSTITAAAAAAQSTADGAQTDATQALSEASTNASNIANLNTDAVANASTVNGGAGSTSDALEALASAIPPAAPVDSVQGSDGIEPTTAQTGTVTLSGGKLLPLDGSRNMTGPADLLGTVNGVDLTASGAATNYLDETGAYSVPPSAGGAVDSVQGSDGITPTGAQTGIVTLSGAALLPLDGSRPMTSPGVLLGTCNGVTLDNTGSGGALYLDDAGQYTAPPSGGGGSGDGGVETFSICTGSTTDNTIWSGGGGGAGDLFGMLSLVKGDFTAQFLTCLCTQASGDTIAMAVYDSSGTKLAETAPAAMSVGFNSLPLLVPLAMTGGQAYYLALWCNGNGARFLRTSGGWTGAGNTIAFEAPNSGGLPASVAGNLSNKVQDHFHVAATS